LKESTLAKLNDGSSNEAEPHGRKAASTASKAEAIRRIPARIDRFAHLSFAGRE
jgi:hypothetical protein